VSNEQGLTEMARRILDKIDREVFRAVGEAVTNSPQKEPPTLTAETLLATIQAMRPTVYYIASIHVPVTIKGDDGTERPGLYAIKDPDYEYPDLIIHPDQLPEILKAARGKLNLKPLDDTERERRIVLRAERSLNKFANGPMVWR
jgi:hypothetical protein